jgi:hypothetical protein
MAKKFVSSRQIKLVQKTSDAVRESLGRIGGIQVYVGSGTAIVGQEWDPVNKEPLDATEEIVYSDSIFTVDKCIIRWVDGTEYEFLPGGRLVPGDVLLKAKLADVLMSGVDVRNDTIFDHARKIIVDGQTVKPSQPPKKTGLRDLYNVSIWCKRVDKE